MKVKSHPFTETYVEPAVFHSSFVVDSKCSHKDMEDMVSTWVNTEDDREIVDVFVDEEFEKINYVSAMDIYVYGDDC